MKRILFSALALTVMTGVAQQNKPEVEQTGTPALMEVKTKKLKVFLQRLEGDQLTFQQFKVLRDITVPADKISSVQFVIKYDEASVKTAFESADYDAALRVLEPIMTDIAQYMSISNNMREPFRVMYESYIGKGDHAKVIEFADEMSSIGDEEALLAQVGRAMSRIAGGDFDGAKKIEDELDNKAAKLYLQAFAQRAQGKPKEAIQTSSMIIEDHAYEMEWLPRAELLNARLYLDMTGPESVITTNSAMITGRMVKNMYKGNNVAGEARIFWADLGGEPIEAAEKAERARVIEARKKAQAEAAERKERERVERAARRAEERRQKQAEAEAAAGGDVDATTETESE